MQSVPQVEVMGRPGFGFLKVMLNPGESISSESGAMSAMSSHVQLATAMKGGFFVAILRKIFGGESLFLNRYSVETNAPSATLRLAPTTPGDVMELSLNQSKYWMQPGSYLAHVDAPGTSGITMKLRYAGLKSLIAREGLFRWCLEGSGKVWVSSYGGIETMDLNGELLVDSGYLMGFEGDVSLHLQLLGSLWTSITSGEGFVLRLSGRGKVYLQTKSMDSFASWISGRL